LPRLPDIEKERERYDIVSFPVEPGDVVAFHPSMLHGGGPTPAGGRRRTLTLRFFGDDVRYAPRQGFGVMLPDEPTTHFEELPALLKPGDPFRHPGFPKVRPR
jgi:ectoine hydroxylase-related dioxygenase (phytanoyl-CoA dioxygenase family)